MTPGKDERDPLDDWLEREIHPLPPPPGTFTMITRRARRRKLRKLAITVTSAAAVAAAAVVAVPTVLALHLGQVTSNGTPVAIGSHTTVTAPASSGSGGAETSTAVPGTVSPVTRPSAATPGPYPAGGAVPVNFRPTSVTFIGQHTGWAIGQAGPPCATQYCTSMVLTQDGGQTWRGVPAPETNGVTGIRFLNGKDGWAYGPQLWATHDYGNTWRQVDTGGAEVTDLETVGDQVFAVFATCSASTAAPSITLFGEHCTEFQLERAPADGGPWSAVTLSGTNGSGSTLTMTGASPQVITAPTLVLNSGTGWLVGPLGQVFSGSPAAGTWQQLSVSPCTSASASTPASAMLGWVLQTGKLIWACDAQGTQATTSVYVSADGGSTWTRQAAAPSFGEATGVASSPAAPYILATTQGIEDFNVNAAQWQQPVSLPGGFSYIGMTTNEQGVAVPANSSLHEVWLTDDGGMNWTQYQFR